MFFKERNTNFIGQYKIYKKICDSLVKYFKASDDRQSGAVGESKVEKNIKDSTDITLSSEMIIKEKCLKEYFEQLTFCLEQYKKKYEYSDKGQINYLLEGVNIQEYKKGQGFKTWHYENNGSLHSGYRHLTFMTYLNTVDNAGTEFYYQNKTFKCSKGDTLIWPAGWTHTHKGQISKKQSKTKYIITGWWRYV